MTNYKLGAKAISVGRWAILSILIYSCVSPYTQEGAAFSETLVIQGLITDEPGPYVINVSRTIPVANQSASQNAVPMGISGCIVMITDDEGNTEKLKEKSNGYYYTQNLQGVVGRSYHLTVATPDGDTYTSSVQKLLPVGDFDYSYQFEQVENPVVNAQLTSKNGFRIYINSKLDPGQEGRVWWKTIGTYHVLTYARARKRWMSVGRPPVWILVPDPPVCAYNGVNYSCSCCDCWVNDYTQKPLLSDPRFIANGEINHLNIGFVQVNKRNMFDKYVFEIHQMSVSEDVYNFWKLVGVSDSNSSSLFQTPSPRTIATFTSENPSAKPVMGYFAASAIKKHYITLTSQDVPYKILPLDSINDSCLTVFRNSTNQKPIFW